ncbi:hypothetical protein B0J14DRAFT_666835 [Halenospora varia]|nr:hypothetical protein B0J14DRAFT_666835 [Halenospora varia]
MARDPLRNLQFTPSSLSGDLAALRAYLAYSPVLSAEQKRNISRQMQDLLLRRCGDQSMIANLTSKPSKRSYQRKQIGSIFLNVPGGEKVRDDPVFDWDRFFVNLRKMPIEKTARMKVHLVRIVEDEYGVFIGDAMLDRYEGGWDRVFEEGCWTGRNLEQEIRWLERQEYVFTERHEKLELLTRVVEDVVDPRALKVGEKIKLRFDRDAVPVRKPEVFDLTDGDEEMVDEDVEDVQSSASVIDLTKDDAEDGNYDNENLYDASDDEGQIDKALLSGLGVVASHVLDQFSEELDEGMLNESTQTPMSDA